MKTLEEIKAMRDELATEKLLKANQHTFGYATAGREINAVLESYKQAFEIGFSAALELMLEREKDCKHPGCCCVCGHQGRCPECGPTAGISEAICD